MTTLANYAHDKGLLIGQKNAPDLAGNLSGILDFAVLEECLPKNFCSTFQQYVNQTPRGKPVFEIEYPESVKPHDDNIHMSKADFNVYCGAKKGNEKFSEIIKHESAFVDGWVQYCGKNETDAVFVTKTKVEPDA
jgi:hypothetical protein